MEKKRIFLLIVAFIAVIGYVVIDQSRTITYQEFMTELIGEDAEVVELTVVNQLDIQKRMFQATIDDPEAIHRIIHEPTMKLKKDIKKSVTPPSLHHHILHIKTKGPNSVSHSFYFNEFYIHDATRRYVIIFDNILTTLFYLIINENLEWIEIELEG